MLAITDCKLWVMERMVYMAIKRSYQEQLAALKRKMVASVPILAVLSEVTLAPILPATSPRASLQSTALTSSVTHSTSSELHASRHLPFLDATRLRQVSSATSSCS